MLFDLRGRGRRRTIQGIYLTLAVLMGGGLVLFGVGSGNGIGGLFDAFKSNGGSAKSVVSQAEKDAERTVRLHPTDAPAWANLARIRFSTASQQYDSSTGQFTSDGLKELSSAASAWNHYLSLNPSSPDPDVARVMVQAFLPGGLNQLDRAATAQEIVAGAQPKVAANWERLAVIAGAGGQFRKSQLAQQRALQLTPASQRKQVEQQISQQKKALASALAQALSNGS